MTGCYYIIQIEYVFVYHTHTEKFRYRVSYMSFCSSAMNVVVVVAPPPITPVRIQLNNC